MTRQTRKIFLAAGGSLVIGGAFGFLGGYFYHKKRAQNEIDAAKSELDSEMARREDNLKRYYKNKFETEVQERAKDLLLEREVSKIRSYVREPSQEPVDATRSDEEPQDVSERTDDSEPATGHAEASESVPERYAPPDTIVRRNVFDDQPDPTQAVDYSQLYRHSGPTAESPMIRDNRQATEYGRSKSAAEEAVDMAHAEDDLDEWYRNHTPDGYIASDLDEDEKAQADAEFDNALYMQGGQYVFLDELSYGRIPSYDQSFVIFCDEDCIWCDEDLRRLEAPYAALGPLSVEDVCKFFELGAEKSGDPDRIFVRNNVTRVDYEVVVYHRSWEQMTFQAEWPK